jgi:hypothetical protein
MDRTHRPSMKRPLSGSAVAGSETAATASPAATLALTVESLLPHRRVLVRISTARRTHLNRWLKISASWIAPESSQP